MVKDRSPLCRQQAVISLLLHLRSVAVVDHAKKKLQPGLPRRLPQPLKMASRSPECRNQDRLLSPQI
jgi:hypothetical protein